MKRGFIVVLLEALCALSAPSLLFAQQRATGTENLPVNQVLSAYYIGRIQNAVGLSDEQYLKILPVLRQYITERFQAASARSRAVTDLRQAVQRKASDDELRPLLKTFDTAENETKEVSVRFHNQIDPLLTPIQQVKLRVFQINVENQLSNLVLRARGGTPPPPPSPD